MLKSVTRLFGFQSLDSLRGLVGLSPEQMYVVIAPCKHFNNETAMVADVRGGVVILPG